jgi:hypothetical protein
MEQRRLRPGDSLDDYCPRERRLTDHVIVAVVDDVVKQTRCVACDTEHAFKDARVPPRRTKKDGGAVLVAKAAEPPVAPEVTVDDEPAPADLHPNLVAQPERRAPKGRRAPAAPPEIAPAGLPPVPPEPAPPVIASPADLGPDDDGPVHRRLIRATLPRPEGQSPARPLPDFTVRQPGTRGFARPPHGKRFAADGARFGAWSGKANGHGGRPGAPAGESRGRQKPGKSRGQRHPHKKSR